MVAPSKQADLRRPRKVRHESSRISSPPTTGYARPAPRPRRLLCSPRAALGGIRVLAGGQRRGRWDCPPVGGGGRGRRAIAARGHLARLSVALDAAGEDLPDERPVVHPRDLADDAEITE